MSAVSDTIAQAKGLIEERGWWSYGDGLNRSLCISTAIQLACHVDVHGGFEYGRFEQAMMAVRSVVGMDPIRYNDTVGRTKEQVLAALDQAIARNA